MMIEVEENPNCSESPQFFFNELEPVRAVRAIRLTDRGREAECEVTGVEKDGAFITAFCCKVTDSGAGYAYLIYGGGWGIRLRPAAYAHEPWNLSNPHQWVEPFKLYGEEKDIVFAN